MSAKRGRQDHYEVLGVNPEAPDEVIRAAYRALAAKYHPDRNPNDRDAELKLKKLNAAFQVLGDPAKRRQYDELTRSPEANDEPRREPARPKVPKRAVREEPPRWKVPREDRASSNTVERTVARTAGGFGRVIGWILGFAIVSAALVDAVDPTCEIFPTIDKCPCGLYPKMAGCPGR